MNLLLIYSCFFPLEPFFFGCHMVCRILVPQPGIKPVPPAVEGQSPIHWTIRELPSGNLGNCYIRLIKLIKGNACIPKSELSFVCYCSLMTSPSYVAGLKEKMKCLKSRLCVVCCVCDACVPLGRGESQSGCRDTVTRWRWISRVTASWLGHSVHITQTATASSLPPLPCVSPASPSSTACLLEFSIDFGIFLLVVCFLPWWLSPALSCLRGLAVGCTLTSLNARLSFVWPRWGSLIHSSSLS